MDARVESALIQIGIRVGSTLILDVLLPWVESLVTAKADPLDVMGMAREIVTGIEKDCAEWDGEAKFAHAFDSLSLWLKEKGVRLADRDVRLTIEMAVQQCGKKNAAPSSAMDRA